MNELKSLLKEYVELDDAISALEARKKKVREELTTLATGIYTLEGSKQVFPGVMLKENTSVEYDEKEVTKAVMTNPLGNAGLLAIDPKSLQAVIGLMVANPMLVTGLTINKSAVSNAIKDGVLELPEGVATISKSYTVAVTRKDLPADVLPAVAEIAAD